MPTRCATSSASRRSAASPGALLAVHFRLTRSLAGFEFALQLDPLAEFAQVAFAADGLLRFRYMCRADARIRRKSLGTRALHRQFGAIAACGGLLDAEGRPFQRNAGVPRVDPLDARITTIVVDDLRGTAPVRRIRGLVV